MQHIKPIGYIRAWSKWLIAFGLFMLTVHCGSPRRGYVPKPPAIPIGQGTLRVVWGPELLRGPELDVTPEMRVALQYDQSWYELFQGILLDGLISSRIVEQVTEGKESEADYELYLSACRLRPDAPPGDIVGIALSVKLRDLRTGETLRQSQVEWGFRIYDLHKTYDPEALEKGLKAGVPKVIGFILSPSE